MNDIYLNQRVNDHVKMLKSTDYSHICEELQSSLAEQVTQKQEYRKQLELQKQKEPLIFKSHFGPEESAERVLAALQKKQE